MKIAREIFTLSNGQSYWKAQLNTGRVLSELDPCQWLEDIIGSGDLGKVVEVILCTPHGDVHLEVPRPYSVFQLNCGIVSLLDQQKVKTAQIVGVIDGEDGACVCAVWDAVTHHLYPEFHTTILHFDAWRSGVAPLGRLNIDALGVRL